MSEGSSYRQILRSSSIIGGASLINIIVSLVRTKVAAMLLGPSGIGLIGLFQNLLATASAVAALGFGTVGTRQIAEAVGREDATAIAAARRALLWGSLVMAAVGTLVVWILRDQIATSLLGNVNLGPDVGWLALGVGLTVAGGSQGALLNGMRRIGDIARMTIWSSFLATAISVGALFLYGQNGLLLFVLASPFASFLFGHFYVARLPEVRSPATSFKLLNDQWRALIYLGSAFMVTGIVASAAQLAVRTMIQHELGDTLLGQFQASWTVSMTYIGLVLAAMGTDYYPRLSAVIDNHEAVNQLVNEQTEVALILAGPLLISTLALAPWIVSILYSESFQEAAALLRWQIIGDALKIASWPLGFILLAAGAGKRYMFAETLAAVVFVGVVWLGLPLVGLNASASGFIAMYLVYLPLVYWLAWRYSAFSWSRRILLHVVTLTVLAFITCFTLNFSQAYGLFLAACGFCGLSIYGILRLDSVLVLSGPVAICVVLIKKLQMKLSGR